MMLSFQIANVLLTGNYNFVIVALLMIYTEDMIAHLDLGSMAS